MYIDQSLYPDLDVPPSRLATNEDKADYVHRVCTAWDFYIHPEPETFKLLSSWKEVFDLFPITTSPAYHAFRQWFGWEAADVPLGILPHEALYIHLDRLEGREQDEWINSV